MINAYRVIIVIVFLIVSGLTYMAAQYIEVGTKHNEDQTKILELKHKWISLHLDNYEYTYWRGCMISSSHKVTVSGGVTQFSNPSEGSLVGDLEKIEDVFDVLVNAYGRAKNVEVEWSEFGFPRFVKIDWTPAIDDECSIVIDNFKLISE